METWNLNNVDLQMLCNQIANLQIWVLALDHCESRPAIGTNETS
jgi:hypothetical protein